MFLTGVISHLCSHRGIIKHVSTNRSSVQIFSHTWTAPLLWMSSVSYWTELEVSHWSWAALHRYFASGARQVKHNKLQLSQTWGIIYLDPAQSVWLYFSNPLHFPVPVAPQCHRMSVKITPTSLVSALGKERARKKYLNVLSHFCLFVSKHNLLGFIFEEGRGSGD